MTKGKLLYRLPEGLVEITLTRRSNPTQLEDVEKFLKPLGLRVMQTLGSGLYGTAWKLSDGSVLKITRDEGELDTAREILVRNIQNRFLPEIYGVGTLVDRGVGFIIREELEKLSMTHMCKLNFLGNLSAYYPITKEACIKMLRRWDLPEISFTAAIDFALPVMETIWNELRPYGIVFRDLHKDNLGRRMDGQLVILDLGAIEFIEFEDNDD